MEITVLGCGTSSGVPLIGCDCAVCTSTNPKNRRRRVSILVDHGDTRVLVDTSPDLRAQLLDVGVTRLDGVLYTHGHADHVHGIDDLRSVNYHMDSQVDVWGSEATLENIRERFGYAFEEPRTWWSSPSLRANVIDTPEFTIGAVTVRPFDQVHGRSTTTGFRFGAAAYSTDMKALPEESYAALAGVKLWIVDCLGYREHSSHAHLTLTLEMIARVKPKLAVLTHMSHQLEYDSLRAELPDVVVPGHDGMVIDVDRL